MIPTDVFNEMQSTDVFNGWQPCMPSIAPAMDANSDTEPDAIYGCCLLLGPMDRVRRLHACDLQISSMDGNTASYDGIYV